MTQSQLDSTGFPGLFASLVELFSLFSGLRSHFLFVNSPSGAFVNDRDALAHSSHHENRKEHRYE